MHLSRKTSFQDVIPLNDATAKPSKSTRDAFRASHPAPVPDEHLERTAFHLRMAEIVRANSAGEHTALVALTLPLAKRGVPAGLYLAWLAFLAGGVQTPFLFVRGNQESVLTFYS